MPERAIEARRLTIERSGRVLFADLSFAVAFGEVFAVLGPNGVGKSSLLRGLGGLLPVSGEVLLAAHPLRSLSTRERARLLSFVPQSPSLASPLPVREVVAHGRYSHLRGIARLRASDREAVERALQQTSLQTLADRPFTRLSQGERQRVMLARGLCTGARILCLDEPTAALDIAHALEHYRLLRNLAQQGFAVVIVLHQLAAALRFADRALLLSPDRRVRIGRAAAVVSGEPVKQVYGVHMRKDAGLEFDLCGDLEARDDVA